MEQRKPWKGAWLWSKRPSKSQFLNRVGSAVLCLLPLCVELVWRGLKAVKLVDNNKGFIKAFKKPFKGLWKAFKRPSKGLKQNLSKAFERLV